MFWVLTCIIYSNWSFKDIDMQIFIVERMFVNIPLFITSTYIQRKKIQRYKDELKRELKFCREEKWAKNEVEMRIVSDIILI